MEDELDRTLREIETQGQEQRKRDKTLTLSWILLGAGVLLLGASAALLVVVLPKFGADPKSRTAWGMVVGGLCVGLLAGVVMTLFFAGRIWRLVLGVSRKKTTLE